MKDTLWQTVLGEIELSVSKANFNAWFKNTILVSQTNDEIVVGVPNVFAVRQFEVRLNQQVLDALRNNGVQPKAIKYVVNNNSSRKSAQSAANKRTGVTTNTQFENTETNKKPLISKVATSPSGLNPKYTFENYIVGGSNELAYSACHAVARSPGTKYNPLFLYGGVGLGKTHLIQAVGNEIIRHQADARVLYISCETFVNDFLDHIRFKKTGFADRYRNVDVLIIDDIQFIARKEKTQEEFFHTFNALHQANKQIIISSDKPPKEIPTLEDRLRSRFEMGMAIDIQSPDFETRCAILQNKAGLSDINLPSDTIDFLATNFQTNIRELEGALNQLLAFCEIRGITPDLQTTQEIIVNSRSSRPQHVTARQIIDRTAKLFQIEFNDITGSKRDKHIVVPRQIAMYLLRSELHLSFPKIASELGRKDHTTAIHSVEKINKEIKINATVRQQVADIRDRLYA